MLKEPNYDLEAACECNGIDLSNFLAVELEITGANYEYDWHWIVKTAEGYSYITGWCDYTGWDCQSNCDKEDADTLENCLLLVPQDQRRIFEDMRAAGECVR